MKRVLIVILLALASIGIYSVIARSISLETQKIGICRALGSTEIKLITNYLWQGFYYLFGGAIIGGLPASISILLAFSTIGEISLDDFLPVPVIFSIVTTIMFLLIAVASYLPAQKAVAMEPGDALRYE